MDPMAGSANNSSDFVRKLYKMLEDPSYSSVVRWGDDGDSFVVLENEKFTKHILPKHFKHSNFASFVRQLNKYDFHKVRQNNEDGQQSQYGPNAWEFKHPEFKANSKDTLDNIRRKAPAPRKQGQLSDEQIPIQQIDLMNQQMVAQAQQIQMLEASNHELRINHQSVVQELLRLHRTVLAHDRVMHDVMKYLNGIDTQQRRSSKVVFNTGEQVQNGNTTNLTPSSNNGIAVPEDADAPASPLLHAQQLMSEYNVDAQLNNFAGFEQMASNFVPDATAQTRGPGSAHSSTSLGYSKLNDTQLEQIVYPMGTTTGIDPMYSDHLPNIPYSLPDSKDQQVINAADLRAKYAENRKKSSNTDPGWSRQPRVLLVEDDPTCRQIGTKFLYSFTCTVDTAFDGLEAVSKIQEGGKYDLILMDIIMPNLDGVSACHIIRQFDRTPIVAMTSNIRSDDIQMYFQHGMDDVLPKPFTRKSLLDMLEKHLAHLKKSSMEPPLVTGGINPTVTQNSGQSARDDLSAAASPANSSGTWNSPSQYSGISPVNPSMGTPYGNYMDNSTNAAYSSNPTTPVVARGPGMSIPNINSQSQQMQQHRRNVSDMTGTNMPAGGDVKRQRMSGNFTGTMPAPQGMRQQ